MDHIKHLERMYAYNTWANRDVALSLQALSEPPERTVAWMAHIVAAEWLWLGRWQHQDYDIPVWPSWSADACVVQLDTVAPLWESVIRELTPDVLFQKVDYVNSQGQPWTSTTDDIITHIIMHGAYHRGQIASEMRTAGQTPQYTDYIHATRQKLVE